MKEELIYYWKNRLNNEHNVDLKINDYIVHFFMINEVSCEGINEWINCDTFDKMESFIAFVILPSCQVSRALTEVDDNRVCVDIASYDETIELLTAINENTQLISEYSNWYDIVESCKEGDIRRLKDLVGHINENVEWKNGILVGIEVFENIKVAGHELIKSYEEENMIDVLEDEFDLSLEEIKNIFDTVDKNEFFQKRVMFILNNLRIF